MGNYNKNVCWQYHIREQNYLDDLNKVGFSKKYTDELSVSDFNFMEVNSDNSKRDIINFIERHEWLGNISQFPTHWFGAYHNAKTKGDLFKRPVLAGALIFNMPNAFSKHLGEDTDKLERLISRGACISWSPKNLASSFIMWAIKWMVENTDYRLFTAYSDPQAKEIGTIYQACNFYYLGQNFGSTERYVNPYTGKIVSDRFFRSRSAFKRYAKELGVYWQKEWSNDQSVLWENIPCDIESKLRKKSKEKQSSSEMVVFPPKHKYAYVLGKNKRETKNLRQKFNQLNKTYKYPKNRGE